MRAFLFVRFPLTPTLSLKGEGAIRAENAFAPSR